MDGSRDEGSLGPQGLDVMARPTGVDCVVIGYNEPPFASYERLIKTYGEESEAYRDLHFSFVELAGQPLSYVDLLNHADRLAAPHRPGPPTRRFESGEIPNLA